jgi:DNA-nicking Smr family endonuclease
MPSDDFSETPFSQPIRVTDVLDLHGFFPEQISEVLEAFIENAMELKLKTLRIIHGKGKSRLKFEVYQFLKDCPHVQNFHNANPESGGWGATIVEIK